MTSGSEVACWNKLANYLVIWTIGLLCGRFYRLNWENADLRILRIAAKMNPKVAND
ncbi:MAG: hypothetical protein ABFC98_02425 [Candidatus Cloacimonas sp.]